MLITVAGSDGAGKSTVSRLVTDQFRADGCVVGRIDRWDIVDSPEYPATRFMRPDVPDTRLAVAEMPNPSRFLFLMWSMSMALVGRRTAPSPEGLTLLDGYWMKHAASEIAYGLDREWTEAVVAGLPQPDLVVYLRIDPVQAWLRKRDGDVVPYECGMDERCSEAAFVGHQRKIINVLDAWSLRWGWTEVDAAAAPHEVVATVRERVQDHVTSGKVRGGA